MIDPKADASEKLRQARELFEAAVDHYDECNAERHRAGRFYYNTAGEGQWEEDDLQYLRDHDRPAFSFNLVRPKINTAIGMHQDMQRKAVPRGVGLTDKFLAEVLTSLLERIYDSNRSFRTARSEMRRAYVKGETDTHIDVSPDPDNPAHIKIELFDVSPHEIHWDPGSACADRSDASHVFYDKWLSKTEFAVEYPDHIDEWDELLKVSIPSRSPSDGDSYAEPGVLAHYGVSEDYRSTNRYYYDRFRKRARVIHLEYVVPRRRTFATINGQSIELSGEEARIVGNDVLSIFGDVEMQTTWAEDVHAIEFIGTKVLYDSTDDDERFQPYDGFSIVPFIFCLDEEENIPFGMMRDLFDPQQEFNKSWSLQLEHTASQQRPGYIAEKEAIPNPDAFETAVQTSSSIAWVEKNALAERRIEQRALPAPSPAAQQRLDNSLNMIDRISGISRDLETPAAHQEAAVTVAIRYHKSQLGMADVREAADHQKRGITRRILETIMRAMPDSQIQEILSDDKYRVQNGMVLELTDNPQAPGQKMVKNQAPLRNLRSLKYDIELETTTSNTTLRMLELQTLMQLQQAQAPVDPMLLVEKATESRAEREQHRQYAEQQAANAAQTAKQAADQAQSQVQQTLQLGAMDQAERARHNRMEEFLKAQKQQSEEARELAAIIERADESEKRAVLEVFKVIQQRQAARTQAPATPQQIPVQGSQRPAVPGAPGIPTTPGMMT